MKYFIGTIDERNGEYEYTHIIKFKTDDKPDSVLEDIARTWYADDPDEEGSCYFFNCGEVATSAGGFEEVTKEIYDGVPFMVELSGSAHGE